MPSWRLAPCGPGRLDIGHLSRRQAGARLCLVAGAGAVDGALAVGARARREVGGQRRGGAIAVLWDGVDELAWAKVGF